MQIRSGLKKVIPQKFWGFFRAIDKYVIDIMYVYLSQRRSVQRRRLQLTPTVSQSIPIYPTDLQFDEKHGEDLEAILKGRGVNCFSGRHSVYVFEHEDIDLINEDIRKSYPFEVGLKITKSREMSSDGTPYYTSSILAPASTGWSMRAVGSVAEKVTVSNLLGVAGVAPMVYDVVKIVSSNGFWHYAQVVQHISGSVITGERGREFIERFKNRLAACGMETISIAEHCDLRPPDFRNNIIGHGSGTWYVDIQNFVLAKKQAVSRIKESAQKYLNTLEECKAGPMKSKSGLELQKGYYSQLSQAVSGLLNEQGITLDSTVLIFDKKAPLQAAPYFLSGGVLWCYFNRKTDISLFEWLFLYGFSRISRQGHEPSSLRDHLVCHPRCNHAVFISCGIEVDMHCSKQIPQFCDTLIVIRANAAAEIPGYSVANSVALPETANHKESGYVCLYKKDFPNVIVNE